VYRYILSYLNNISDNCIIKIPPPHPFQPKMATWWLIPQPKYKP